MATPTYIPLATTTLAATADSVTFYDIPTQDVDGNDFGDLILVADKKSTGGSGIDSFTINGDTGSNYNYVIAEGTGSSTYTRAGTTTSGRYSWSVYATGSSGANLILQFMDYSATDKHKSVLARNSSAATGVQMAANRWANTSAITSISLVCLQDTFAAGSTFKLFGVAK